MMPDCDAAGEEERPPPLLPPSEPSMLESYERAPVESVAP